MLNQSFQMPLKSLTMSFSEMYTFHIYTNLIQFGSQPLFRNKILSATGMGGCTCGTEQLARNISSAEEVGALWSVVRASHAGQSSADSVSLPLQSHSV